MGSTEHWTEECWFCPVGLEEHLRSLRKELDIEKRVAGRMWTDYTKDDVKPEELSM